LEMIGPMQRRFALFAGWGTIRSRLYGAFGVAACMTVVCSLFAFFASSNFSTTMTEIVSRSMPATVESLRLSAEASHLVAFAPRLMAVEDESRRAEIDREIDAQTQTLYTTIERLRGLDANQNDRIDSALTALNERLSALDSAVGERIKISVLRRASAASVRKVRDQLLEVTTPAIDDANFNLMTRDQKSDGSATINQLIDTLRSLLEIQAKINLLAGLLIESSMVADVADLTPLGDLILAADRGVQADLRELPDPDQRQKIGALYSLLAAIAGGHGIVSLRANELDRAHETEQAFAAALADSTKLKQAVDALVEREGAFAQHLSAQATRQMSIGRIILVVLSLAALLAACAIAWLYVGRNIVRRLTLLSSAMRRIAKGDKNVSIPLGGHDEIAEMAGALLVFREAMEEASTARQRDARRAEESEQRSQKLETATERFKLAVNEIIQALDDAARSMDECANTMAATSGSNQELAIAAASASKDATANVENVAVATEEMAQSVAEISLQAHSSADIAQQASDEATGIIEAVAQLAASVDQIKSMSTLIGDIAAQTNLLALNATIEAARAGDAGRGFAVVAHEVKELAAQTGKATGDISQQTAAIEKTTSRAVEAMKAIANTILRLNENALGISAAVQQQDVVTRGIAQTANTAANYSRTVSTSVAGVSDAAGKTGRVANSVLKAGGELATRAQRLRTEVERFLAHVRAA
jgi:methyl-accepting chemotaxis protein